MKIEKCEDCRYLIDNPISKRHQMSVMYGFCKYLGKRRRWVDLPCEQGKSYDNRKTKGV